MRLWKWWDGLVWASRVPRGLTPPSLLLDSTPLSPRVTREPGEAMAATTVQFCDEKYFYFNFLNTFSELETSNNPNLALIRRLTGHQSKNVESATFPKS